MASCWGSFEQLGHYFHPTSLLAHLGPVARQNSTLQTRKEAVEKMNHPNFLCSSTEMEHPWCADWLSARWIYASTNLSGIFRLHAIQFATICVDNQKAQVGTKDWTVFFWAMRQAIFLAFPSPNTWELDNYLTPVDTRMNIGTSSCQHRCLSEWTLEYIAAT